MEFECETYYRDWEKVKAYGSESLSCTSYGAMGKPFVKFVLKNPKYIP